MKKYQTRAGAIGGIHAPLSVSAVARTATVGVRSPRWCAVCTCCQIRQVARSETQTEREGERGREGEREEAVEKLVAHPALD